RRRAIAPWRPWPLFSNARARQADPSKPEPAQSGRVFDVIRMVQCGRDLVPGEIGAVIAIDQQRHAAASVDVARPSERIIERREFLEQELVLLQRRDGFGAARSDIDAIAHEFAPGVAIKCKREPSLAALAPR